MLPPSGGSCQKCRASSPHGCFSSLPSAAMDSSMSEMMSNSDFTPRAAAAGRDILTVMGFQRRQKQQGFVLWVISWASNDILTS